MADKREYEADIAIIGSGGAGISAGIEALDAGARAVSYTHLRAHETDS